jgi:hypothetical protein
MTDRKPRCHSGRATSCERSSALMLAPALLMVLLALGAIAVDLTLMHAAKRSAYRSLSAAADDAASMVDSRHLLLTGEVRLDEVAARDVARMHMGLVENPPEGIAEPTFDFVGEPDITVREDRNDPTGLTNVVEISATVEVEHIFLSAVPGMGDSTEFEISTKGRMVN